MTPGSAATKDWRLRNPEKAAALRAADLKRQKNDPAWKEKRAEYLRKRHAIPEVRARRHASHKKWVEANKEKWYEQCRDRLARKPWIRLLIKARVRSKASGLECNLPNEWGEARWTGRCELTGIPFAPVKGPATAFSPSLDRIDSKKGYTPENCRFVLWAINRFRSDGTDEEMIRIAKALIERN